ncbi:ABC transporter substrate-binding protein [Silvibacterium acidisoli]|uniref:ABC transporter substrate-binding protein n=1 Tax=Acidobacteriaceae bacterium ZG23-2 TaxID=2883246 RepID=UPI00406D3713
MAETKLRVAVREFSDFENAFAEQIALYRQAHPDVEFEAVPFDVHSLHAELFKKDGLKRGTWDIGFISTDWTAEAVETGSVVNLSPYMSAKPVADWPEGWAASITEPLIFDDGLYSLPWHDGPECLIYRRDLFEDASEQEAFRNQYGYELKPPRTWKQFTDIAKFFTRPEKGLYGTLIAAFPDGHNTLYDFALQVWSRGGELTDANGVPQLTSKAALDSLEFYRRTIADASLCYPGSAELDSTRSGDVVLSGSIAMMVNWFGFAARCDRPGSPLQGRIAIAPIPSEEGVTSASLSVFWTLGIGSGSEQKQAAYDFLHFLTSEERDLGIVKHGTVGVRLSTWRHPQLRQEVPVYGKIEEISLGARKLPRSTALAKYADVLNDMVVEALTTSESSIDILTRAQQRVEKQGILLK